MSTLLNNLITHPDTASLLFDNMPRYMYFMKDAEFNFIKLNQQLADKIGLPIEEIIGKNDFDIFQKPIATLFRKDDQQVLNSKQPIKNKVELIPSQIGQVDWAVTTKVPILDEEDNVIAIAAVTRPLLSSHTATDSTLEISDSLNYIKKHFAEKITIETLAKLSFLSISAFERKFKKILNITPINYIRNTRIQAASKLLIKGNDSIAAIAHQCGFYDQSHFSKNFHKIMNISPLNYRKQYRI